MALDHNILRWNNDVERMGPMEVAQRGVSIANMMDERQSKQDAAGRQQQQRDIMAQTPPEQTAQAMTQQGLGPEAQQYDAEQAAIELKRAQARAYGEKHAPAALGLEKLKSEHGANMLNQFFADHDGKWEDPQTTLDYETMVPLLRMAGIDQSLMPDKYDPATVSYRSKALAAQGYDHAKAVDDKLKTSQVSGDMPEGTPTEQKRHNLATEEKGTGKDPLSLISGQLPPEQTAALSRALDNGLDPKWLNSRTAGVFAQQEIEHPGRKWNQLSAAAIFERSQTTMNTKTLLNAITPLMDNLLEAGKKLGNSNVKFLNKASNVLKEETGNPDIVRFNNQRDDMVAEIERGLLGTGVLSDSKYLRAVHNINSAQSYPQLEAAVKATKIVIAARLDALHKGPNYVEGSETKSTPDAESAKKKYKLVY